MGARRSRVGGDDSLKNNNLVTYRKGRSVENGLELFPRALLSMRSPRRRDPDVLSCPAENLMSDDDSILAYLARFEIAGGSLCSTAEKLCILDCGCPIVERKETY